MGEPAVHVLGLVLVLLFDEGLVLVHVLSPRLSLARFRGGKGSGVVLRSLSLLGIPVLVLPTCLDQKVSPSRHGIAWERHEVVELKHSANLVLLQGPVPVFLEHMVSPFIVHHEPTNLAYTNCSTVLSMIFLLFPVRDLSDFVVR